MWIIKEEEEEEATAIAVAQEEVMATADEGNRGPAMEVHLCGGHVSFGHDHGGPTMEVLWWSGEKRAKRWERTQREKRDERECENK